MTRVIRSHIRRAFTLVEMVIVIAIIVLLVALTVALVSGLQRGSETRTTENMLQLLETAYAEWKATADRDLTYGDATAPAGVSFDILEPSAGNEHEVTDILVTKISKNSAAKDILANLSVEQLKRHNPPDTDITVLDAWGTEIVTVFPGRKWIRNFDPGAQPPNPDGTIQTGFETAFGVCQNGRVRFVSAGPDGQLGDRSAAVGTPAYDDSIDNIYSYPLEAP